MSDVITLTAADARTLIEYAERVPGRLLTDREFAELDQITQRIRFDIGVPITGPATLYPNRTDAA